MSATSIILALIAGYAAILIIAMQLTQSVRVRMAEIVDDLLEDGTARTAVEQRHLAWLIDSATSTTIGFLMPLTALNQLIDELLGVEYRVHPDLKRLDGDKRYQRALDYYVISVIACSPFAFIIALPAISLVAAMLAARNRGILRAFEKPVLSASDRLQPC